MNREQEDELRLKNQADKLEKQIDEMKLEAQELVYKLEKSHLNLIANMSPQVLFMVDQAYSNLEFFNNQQDAQNLEQNSSEKSKSQE